MRHPSLAALRSRPSSPDGRPVRFVIDAQLPKALASLLEQLGHDAIHVKVLPGGAAISDTAISRFADAEHRAVVTKDADFRHTHDTGGHPRQLLLVTVGNQRNRDLLALVFAHHTQITRAFDETDFVELGATALILHPRRDTHRQEPREESR